LTSLNLTWLDESHPVFPDTSRALSYPNGLLAAGGNLLPQTLIAAYRRGIFPWYEQGQPILWWSPDPRMVLYPAELHISRSMRAFLGRHEYQVSLNRDFAGVIAACAQLRPGSQGTWITDAVAQAYVELHQAGLAHSIEAWEGDTLVGGLYGICMDRMFFGESMFSRRDNASKLALVHLVAELETIGVELIDCQVPNPHLESLGARLIPRAAFEAMLPESGNSSLSGTRQLFLPPGWP
jgi:leucyl/phenylalanyl-tRNA--protein transferase